MSDFTILIQGPLNKISLESIENYQKYGEVVISCWDDDDLSLIPKGIRYKAAPLPDRNEEGTRGFKKNSTWYWAITSQLNGFELVKTKYVIKTRSDESYFNLKPFIKTFLKDPNLFVCGSIFVRRWEDCGYHIGDHIYALKTKMALEAARFLVEMYRGKGDLAAWADQEMYVAEQILAYAYLHIKDKSLFYDERICQKKTMLENFSVVDINLTQKFTAQYAHQNITFKDKFNNLHRVNCHKDLRDDSDVNWLPPRSEDWEGEHKDV